MSADPVESLSAPLLVDRREAARMLAMSESWLWQATARGEVACVRIGRSVRYDPRDLQAYIDRQKQGQLRVING
jgi:predicted DNA-binding transcriptional regulator AlpA